MTRGRPRAWRTLTVTALAVALVGVPALHRAVPILIWNASASVPVGLYLVWPMERAAVADLVVVRPPEALAHFLADRGYLAPGVPLIKRVAARQGQVVCRDGGQISVDGAAVAQAHEIDQHGRALPSWSGCRVLHDGEVFLINQDTPDSLDGRYFGPLPTASIVGRALPLWTDEVR
jgi:conjugative transfer signal peptidase TraF